MIIRSVTWIWLVIVGIGVGGQVRMSTNPAEELEGRGMECKGLFWQILWITGWLISLLLQQQQDARHWTHTCFVCQVLSEIRCLSIWGIIVEDFVNDLIRRNPIQVLYYICFGIPSNFKLKNGLVAGHWSLFRLLMIFNSILITICSCCWLAWVPGPPPWKDIRQHKLDR